MPSVINRITKASPTDNYILVDDSDFGGGFRVTNTITDRNAIVSSQRKQGMFVFNISDGHYYSLQSNLTSWTDLGTSLGGGGGTSTLDGVILNGATFSETMIFDNSSTGTTTALYKSGTASYYIGLGDNANLSAITHGSFIKFGNGIFNINATNTSNGGGSLNIGNNLITISASDTSGNQMSIQSSTSVVTVTSQNSQFAGVEYDSTAASYVSNNGGDLTIFNRAYNDNRYILGGVSPSIVLFTSGGSMFGAIDMGSNKITSVATASNLLDAVNYGQLTNIKLGSISLTSDGGGAVVTIGSLGFIVLPYAGTITDWYLVGDQSGSITFDIKKSGTSIIGAGNKPTLTSAQRANAAVSGWTTTTIAVNDELEFTVSSATTITRIYLMVKITKS